MTKVRLVRVDDLKVLTIEGFVARFEREYRRVDHETGRYPTQKVAWERTEAVYRSLVGRSRYATYNAFREALVRFRRKNWRTCNKNG